MRVVLTSEAGPRIHPVTGRPSDHKGDDYAVPEGSSVLAVAGGVVSSMLRAHPTAGNMVVVDHRAAGLPYRSSYLHLQRFASILPGRRVGRGELLGLVGRTGRVTGPHLHLQLERLTERGWETLPSAPLIDWRGLALVRR